MKIINIKKINKEDWKKFLIWNKKNNLFFKKNFYTKLISIIEETQYEDNLIEFYIFNKFELKNKYFLNWPKWIEKIKGNSIQFWIENLLDKFLNKNLSKLLFKVFLNLKKYLDKNKKNFDEEYKLVEKYWNFINNLRNTNNKKYNYLIEHINKSIHIDFKGFKE